MAKILCPSFAPPDDHLLEEQPVQWELLKRCCPEKAKLIAEYTRKFLAAEVSSLDAVAPLLLLLGLGLPLALQCVWWCF